MRIAPPFRVCMVIACAVALAVLAAPLSHAQWAGLNLNNFISLSSIEQITGPFFPETSLANTFRSEWGFRFSAAEIAKALLKGSKAGEIDLSPDREINENTLVASEDLLETYLNGMPLRVDAYVTLRLWRLGIRGNYAFFHNRSNRPGLGYVDFTGPSAGLDFDIVDREWLKMGVCADYYFMDPSFQGYVPANTVKAWDVRPEYNKGVLVPGTGIPFTGGYDVFNGTIRGNKPVTIGTYTRYIPPEIIGFPVYFESNLNYRIKGSHLASYGAALVFRPQIYRFDILARMKFQRLHLVFEEEMKSTVGIGNYALPQTWQIDASWNIYGMEFAMYF